MAFEGFFDHPTRGHIRIDNIHMSSSMELEECTRKSRNLSVYLSLLLSLTKAQTFIHLSDFLTPSQPTVFIVDRLSEREGIKLIMFLVYTQTHTHTHTHIKKYIYKKRKWATNGLWAWILIYVSYLPLSTSHRFMILSFILLILYP